MTDVTVKEFAGVVGIPMDRLVGQLDKAGFEKKTENDLINDQEKRKLLSYLRHLHGKDNQEVEVSQMPKKITLNRRSSSQLKVVGVQGKKPKIVDVQVRKKRTYVKRAKPEATNAPVKEEETKTLTQELGQAPVVAVEMLDVATPIIFEEDQKKQQEEQEKIATKEAAKEKAQLEREAKLQKQREAKEVADKELSAKKAAKAKKAAERSNTKTKVQTQVQVKTKVKVKTKLEELETEIAQQKTTVAKPSVKSAPRVKAVKKPVFKAEPEIVEEDEPPTEIDEAAKKVESKIKDFHSKDKGKRRRDDDEKELRNENKEKRRSRRKGTRQTQPNKYDEPAAHGFTKPTAPVVHEVQLMETVTVGELAKKMSVRAAEVIKTMMTMGSMVTINQVIDQETAAIVVEEMGHIPKLMKENSLEESLTEQFDGEEVSRAPVVTIMGHVDHGKTSLLDYIRVTKVAEGEAGGITQHIGAYHVQTPKGMITFLDTPGHAAFTAMRARGAKVTDIVVLVVAADDGVMPRTIEAIQHAKAAEVPIIVAINKMDKSTADADKVKQALSHHGVIADSWGGDTMMVPVSAKTGMGIDDLLDSILLQAEVLELTTVVDGSAAGVILESRLDQGRGVIASLLIQRGTLRKGDMLLAGQEYGRVRALLDENGQLLNKAGPSIPVEILGLSGTPNAGDEVVVVSDERKAREVALFRQGKYREVKLAKQQAAKLENMFSQMEEGATAKLNIVLKADVNGSAEALRDTLISLSSNEVKVVVVSSGVGGINETDVNLALASQAIIIGFNVRADATARRLIAKEEVDVHYHSIIFEAIDEIKRAISGMLSPDIKEEIIGLAEVRDVFRSAKIGAIAGCMILEGTVKRHNPIRVLRDNVVIFEGELESLRRFKDDVNEVRHGMECGIGVKNYNDVKVGDQIEVFERIEVSRSLGGNSND